MYAQDLGAPQTNCQTLQVRLDSSEPALTVPEGVIASEAMAAPPTGGRILRAGRPTVRQGLSPSRRLDSEVIDLSADADHTAAAAPAPVASTPANDLRGTKLEDFAIGDRLGQTRDGGEGFQVRRLVALPLMDS